MQKKTKISTLFLDIGGVLLTNGWEHESRLLASKTFNLDLAEMESRHRLTFDTYEVGKLSLDGYLHRVIFYKKRSFTSDQFKKFMFSQSKAFPQMIDLVCKLKTQHQLKIAVVSNEGRELNDYRIKKFKLGKFVDFFISSSFVHFRKPDVDMYRITLDIAQVPPEQVVYIEDRLMFIEVAESQGIRGIHHVDYPSTLAKLASIGLKVK